MTEGAFQKHPVKVIRPGYRTRWLGFADVWEHRDLLFLFAWRDIKVRYKQTLLGLAWTVLPPFFTMVVYSLIFGKLAKIPSEGYPYPIFLFSALLGWQLFARVFTESSGSLVANAEFIKKVYVPRLTLHMAPALPGTFDFGVAFMILLAMMAYYGIVPSWAIFAVLPLMVLTAVSALAFGLWFSVINVGFRDARFAVPFLTQIWFFMTPVIYPGSTVPEPWRTLLYINPMTSVVEGYRWAVLGTAAPDPMGLVISSAVTLAVGGLGLMFMRSFEGTFADRI